MTTRATFDARPPGENQGVASLDDVRDLLAGPEVASILPPGTIGPQTNLQGAGIPLSAIRRGLLGPLYGRDVGSYTVTATTFTEVDSSALAGTLLCTGRPVIVLLSALVIRSATTVALALSVTMDGTEITGTNDGMGWVDVAAVDDRNVVNWRILTPRPGPRRFALVARMSAGTGTIWSSASDDVVSLAVVEL